MAYKVSSKYKEQVFSNDPSSEIRIKVNGTEINSYDYVKELKQKDSCFESDTFSLGSAIIDVITLELDNLALNCKPEEVKNVSIDYGEVYEDETIEWIPIGVYDVVMEPDTSSSDCTTFTLYDYMNRLDVEYDGSEIVPCTRYELYLDICSKCGVEAGNDNFLNGDVMVNVYDNTLTARNYMQFLSERAGGFAKADRTGKICIKSFNETDVITLTEDEEDLIELENYDSLKTITGVIYENAITKYEYGNSDGEVVYLSDESPFVCEAEEVEKIYNTLNGLAFQSANFKMFIDPSWDTGDVINFLGKTTFIQKDWTYNMGFIGNINTTLNATSKISNVQKISTPKKIKRLQSLLDEESGRINILTEKTDEIVSNVAELNIETEEIKMSVTQVENEVDKNYNEITQTIDNFLVSIQNTGGANLIQNSVMFAYSTDGIPSNWELQGDGTLDIHSSSEAVNAGSASGHVFVLKDKMVKQRISVKADRDDIPEDEKVYYSFSTKIKKNIVGTCYVKISNAVEEYIIELGEGQESFYGDYEIKGLLPKTNYYDIEFYGSAESEATFTDNMFAIGAYKSQWQQASGEIMNTQVNVNLNGVLVKSSVYVGDYTVMSPLEFAGYSNINGTITKVFSLNKDVTLVKKLEAEDQIKMYPIKVVPITEGDTQGWAFVPTEKGVN